MKHTHDVMRERLHKRAGLTESPKLQATYEELKRSEWSAEFERLMRNRLIMGAIRYGRLKAPGKPQYDRVASAIKRLAKYQETGNQEFLVDAANLCVLEFEEGIHPKKHFGAIDEHNEHCRVVASNGYDLEDNSGGFGNPRSDF